jgi:hypothetical protein
MRTLCAYTKGPHTCPQLATDDGSSGPVQLVLPTGRRRSTACFRPRQPGRPCPHHDYGYAHTMRIRQEDPHTCPQLPADDRRSGPAQLVLPTGRADARPRRPSPSDSGARTTCPTSKAGMRTLCAYARKTPTHAPQVAADDRRSGPAQIVLPTGRRRSTACPRPRRLGHPHACAHHENGYAHLMRISSRPPHMDLNPPPPTLAAPTLAAPDTRSPRHSKPPTLEAPDTRSPRHSKPPTLEAPDTRSPRHSKPATLEAGGTRSAPGPPYSISSGVPTGTRWDRREMSALRRRTHPWDGLPGIRPGWSVPWTPITPPPGQSVRVVE